MNRRTIFWYESISDLMVGIFAGVLVGLMYLGMIREGFLGKYQLEDLLKMSVITLAGCALVIQVLCRITGLLHWSGKPEAAMATSLIAGGLLSNGILGLVIGYAIFRFIHFLFDLYDYRLFLGDIEARGGFFPGREPNMLRDIVFLPLVESTFGVIVMVIIAVLLGAGFSEVGHGPLAHAVKMFTDKAANGSLSGIGAMLVVYGVVGFLRPRLETWLHLYLLPRYGP